METEIDTLRPVVWQKFEGVPSSFFREEPIRLSSDNFDLEAVNARIQIGMAFLDENIPGWEYVISTISLNMRFSDTCIIGQLFNLNSFSNFNVQLDEMGVQFPSDYGFSTVPGHDYDLEAFGFLTEAWIKAIIVRRGEK